MKKPQLNTLAIDRYVVHNIPRRKKAEEAKEIELSEALPKIEKKANDFFRLRLNGTLAKRGQMVEVDPKIQRPRLPEILESWFAKPGQLLAPSQDIAKHLYEVQDGTASVGLLGVAKGTISGRYAIAIMKLPKESGLEFETTTVNGKPTVTVVVHGNLMLTQNTKVFKAGLFWQEKKAIYGLVSDDQTGEGPSIAGFFLTSFLGCRKTQRPSVLTRKFKQAVTKFINSEVDDEETKMNYYYALHAELHSNATQIDTDQFVKDHIGAEHQDALLNALRQDGVPAAAFTKDMSDIPSKRRATVKTEGGITISGDADAMNSVTIEQFKGEEVIVVRDRIAKVK